MWNRDSSKCANRALGGTSRGVGNDSVFVFFLKKKKGEFFLEGALRQLLCSCRVYCFGWLSPSLGWSGQGQGVPRRRFEDSKKNNGLVSADPQDLHSLAWSAWPLETIHHTPLEYDFDRQLNFQQTSQFDGRRCTLVSLITIVAMHTVALPSFEANCVLLSASIIVCHGRCVFV